MDVARAELGTKELPGAMHNPRVVSYYADAGHPEIRDDETAWCAAFVGAVLKRAGYPFTGSLTARSYLSYGRKIDRPEPGCIVVFWRGSPSSWQGHVAFCVRDDGGTIRVIGGNQNNAVTEESYPKSQVLGYRMPIGPIAPAATIAQEEATMANDAKIDPNVFAAVAEKAADVAVIVAPKYPWQSITIWGGVLSAVATVLPVVMPLFGVAAGTQTLVMGLVGAAMTFIGRVGAVQPVGLSKS
jgi:uncharacterized protein (TIGR02594 family)